MIQTPFTLPHRYIRYALICSGIALMAGCEAHVQFSSKPDPSMDQIVRGPIINLSNAVKGPLSFQSTLTGDVKGVTFSNVSPGISFVMIWTQDQVGGHKVEYAPSVVSACDGVDLSPNSITTQYFTVNVEGNKVIGLGCTTSSVPVGSEGSGK